MVRQALQSANAWHIARTCSVHHPVSQLPFLLICPAKRYFTARESAKRRVSLVKELTTYNFILILLLTVLVDVQIGRLTS